VGHKAGAGEFVGGNVPGSAASRVQPAGACPPAHPANVSQGKRLLFGEVARQKAGVERGIRAGGASRATPACMTVQQVVKAIHKAGVAVGDVARVGGRCVRAVRHP